MEIWKDIEGYEGIYQISSLGNIKSLHYNNTDEEKYLKICKDKRGYSIVSLCKNNTQRNVFIHQLVAKTFIPNPNNYKQVNHKDENPSNNEISNLEWCSSKYNCNYGNRNINIKNSNINNPKKSKRILQLDKNGIFIKEWASSMEVYRTLGFSNGDIIKCCKNKLKTVHGYIWRYKNEEV